MTNRGSPPQLFRGPLAMKQKLIWCMFGIIVGFGASHFSPSGGKKVSIATAQRLASCQKEARELQGQFNALKEISERAVQTIKDTGQKAMAWKKKAQKQVKETQKWAQRATDLQGEANRCLKGLTHTTASLQSMTKELQTCQQQLRRGIKPRKVPTALSH